MGEDWTRLYPIPLHSVKQRNVFHSGSASAEGWEIRGDAYREGLPGALLPAAGEELAEASKLARCRSQRSRFQINEGTVNMPGITKVLCPRKGPTNNVPSQRDLIVLTLTSSSLRKISPLRPSICSLSRLQARVHIQQESGLFCVVLGYSVEKPMENKAQTQTGSEDVT